MWGAVVGAVYLESFRVHIKTNIESILVIVNALRIPPGPTRWLPERGGILWQEADGFRILGFLRFLDFRMLGFSDSRIFGFSDFRILGFSDSRMLKFSEIRILGTA